MEKKSGIVVTQEGLFIPAHYFGQMAKKLDIVVSPGEIRIQSSVKGRQLRQKSSPTQRSSGRKGRTLG
jgi:hypothetical protein